MALEEFSMFREKIRLSTFKAWPFPKNCKCTPEAMARAGFYCPDKKYADLARCFLCEKELDGWEASDDPWIEHESHSPDCPFVKLNKSEEEMTVENLLELERDRIIFLLRKEFKQKMAEFQAAADLTKKKINALD